MKLFLVALCTVSVVALVSGQHSHGPPPRGQPHPNSEEARRSEQMIRRCQSQEQATESDMEEFQQQRKPSTMTGKCLHACLMESIGLIENGALSVANSVKFTGQMARGNNELMKIIEEISNKCVNVKDNNRCEMAFKIMICTEEGISKRREELKRFMPRQPEQ